MIIFIIGLVLLLIPFIFINLFSDKKVGFLYILFFLLISQSIIGIITQYFGIFYYNVIIYNTLAIDIILIILYPLVRSKFLPVGRDLEKKIIRIDWAIIAVVCISLLSLYQVHFNYTGKANLVIDSPSTYHEVKNMKYVYPYFSDEWYAVSLINSSIYSHSLPITDILTNTPFLNLEIVFHSFIAEIMLILGLDILTQYTLLSIFINALIVLVIYIFLRINNISRLSSGVCALFALYITCGANLPGLWNLIPFNLGILFSLITFCFIFLNNLKTATLSSLITVLFYPPLFMFSFVAIIVSLFENLLRRGKKVITVARYCTILVGLLAILYFIARAIPLFSRFIDFSLSKIFFNSFVTPYIPQLNFFEIIPLPVILLSIFGVSCIYKKRAWLFVEFIFGIIVWFIYALTSNRFFIEYERVAIFVSVIAIIVSGFGLRFVEEWLSKKFCKKGKVIFKIASSSIIILFLLLVPFYTRIENWKKIVLVNPNNGIVAYPKAPANNYLTSDDIEIFKDISNKRFLSIPWKGTVIGVAFNNYPFITKEGNISIGNLKYLDYFMKPGCETKTNMAVWFDLDYIYLYEFDCPCFEKVVESGEGLVLYKFKKQTGEQ